MTLSFIQECSEKNLLNTNEPLYIAELGTGPGKFSFYILNEIFEQQKKWDLNT